MVRWIGFLPAIEASDGLDTWHPWLFTRGVGGATGGRSISHIEVLDPEAIQSQCFYRAPVCGHPDNASPLDSTTLPPRSVRSVPEYYRSCEDAAK
ncbi:MAG TPA: hypothetical protein DCE44_18010 [Verrucomicrobiales bacterium]|nr:hypothetical protein [Verrucomicrobiales bacterium]